MGKRGPKPKDKKIKKQEPIQDDIQDDDDIEQIENTADTIRKESDNIYDLVTTGSDLFDLVAGGGFPFGKIVNIVGDSSTGKTLLVSEFISRAKRVLGDTLEWFYDDAECGYSFDSKKIWGIEIVSEDQENSETLEDFQVNLTKRLNKLKDGKKFVYVLDSFDSLTSDEEIKFVDQKLKAHDKQSNSDDEKKQKGSYGTSKAKGTSQFFRSLRKQIKEKKCLLIIVSQVRENIGVTYGPKYSRMGGKALDFYPAQVFWLAVAEKYYVKDRCVGVSIKIMNTKNKIGSPFRECVVDILFDYGVDNVKSNLYFLYDLKTEKYRNKEKVDTVELEWDGTGYSLRRLVRYIEKENLENELTKRVIAKWKGIELKANMSIDRKQKF